MQVNIHEAKTRFSELIERVQRGEEVIIGKAGKPVARLTGYGRPGEPRLPGGWTGRVEIASDFDDLPAEVRATFTGEAE
ncbi:MAG: type II toxin-antitoxin system Phd/YefM family antitoxin [Candidatus Dormibacteraeota bacterium]|nr:type II toxin-antitoxin system Phd/YefM family antitoxin [Candidatus Dormibacteraeota bacterium]